MNCCLNHSKEIAAFVINGEPLCAECFVKWQDIYCEYRAAQDKGVEPLSEKDLFYLTATGVPIPVLRALATFAKEENWVQIYNGEGVGEYKPRACEWAFIGPVRPPYELAQNALKGIKEK